MSIPHLTTSTSPCIIPLYSFDKAVMCFSLPGSRKRRCRLVSLLILATHPLLLLTCLSYVHGIDTLFLLFSSLIIL
jgi:hypothetical protein